MNLNNQGRLKFYCCEKGYGFIRNDEGDIFLHATELPNLYEPMPGDLIEYVTKRTRKGVVATQVKFISRADKYKHLGSNERLNIVVASPTSMGGNRE